MTFKGFNHACIYVTDPAARLTGINVPENILLGQTNVIFNEISPVMHRIQGHIQHVSF